MIKARRLTTPRKRDGVVRVIFSTKIIDDKGMIDGKMWLTAKHQSSARTNTAQQTTKLHGNGQKRY